MRYESIQVTSFRSIRESPKLELDERMTVVVGENNSGKTALLDAMAGDVTEPHMSPKTISRRDAVAAPTQIYRWFHFGRDDIEALADEDPTELGICVGRDFSLAHMPAVRALLSARTLRFESPIGTVKNRDSFLGLFPLADGRTDLLISRDKHREWTVRASSFSSSYDIRTRLLNRFFLRQVQRSRAERPIDTKGPVGTSLDAGSAAERLASALHFLQSSDPPRMRRVVDTVSRIVPSVCEITVPNLPKGMVGIHIWPFPERADLAVAIERAGTGVWQVLSIVYALLTAQEPQVFLIDEPNNYLHPKAVLDLIALLKSHPQHQYVIATHSPEVISACEPGIVHRVWLEDGESQFEQIDPQKVEDQRRTLRGLGVRLSAFFGADEVLWVEGPTEEAVFPKLLAPTELLGLRILAVHDTGPFNKNPERIAAIYKKLVDGIALIPPAVGFFFDRENQSQNQVDQLKVTLGDKLALTERRLLECYFLDPQAIAETITDGMRDAGDSSFSIAREQVEAWIRDQEAAGRKYSATKTYDEKHTEWLRTVHAANLLKHLFGALTDQKLAYQKTWHGPEIVDRMLARDPKLMDPLRKELRAVIKRGRQSDATTSE